MKKKEIFGVDGVYSQNKKEKKVEYFHMSPFEPPKVGYSKKEPSIIMQLFRKILRRKKKDGAL